MHTTIEKKGWHIIVLSHRTLGEMFPDMGKPNPEVDEWMDDIFRLLDETKQQNV